MRKWWLSGDLKDKAVVGQVNLGVMVGDKTVRSKKDQKQNLMCQEFNDFCPQSSGEPPGAFEWEPMTQKAGRTAGRLQGHGDLSVDYGEGVDEFKRH